MVGWQTMGGRALDEWRADELLRTSVNEPWPQVRAAHLRGQHRTLPFVAGLNQAFSFLTAAVFQDAAGWPFLFCWLLLQTLWGGYMVRAWWVRRQRPHRLATPQALRRLMAGTVCLSVLWSVAIWVWFGLADDSGRSFVVAVVVGNLCVGALALSAFARAVWAYLLPQALATGAALWISTRQHAALELLALMLYVLALAWFGLYMSRLITAHVIAEQQVRRSLKELALARDHLHSSEKLASLGALVAGVSHEVNTPLGVAVTACSTVAETLEHMHLSYLALQLTRPDFEQALGHAIEGVGILQNNLGRAAQLITGFKHTVVSQMDERLCEFEVMEVLRTLVVSLQPAMRRVRLVPALDGPGRLVVRSYPSALVQIVTNLLMNSALHAFDGVADPRAWITVTHTDTHWRLSYADNGVGVPEDLHPRLFEPFFTTRRGSGGTGLGLHIVYTLVTQRLGGQLSLQSAPGAGLRFQIELPRVAPAVQALPDDVVLA